MSSINGMPILNSSISRSNTTPGKKNKKIKWILIILIIIVILYFVQKSRRIGRASGETCRYNTDCKNKNCKCKNDKTECAKYNKVCA